MNRRLSLKLTRSAFSPMWVIATALSLFLWGTGCEGPTAPDRLEFVGEEAFLSDKLPLPEDADDLNATLRQLLVQHSQGMGLDYYKLPSLSEFQELPQDPLNPINGAKITLGMYLFNDPGMAVNNVRPEGFQTYSCGSCHPAQSGFYSNLIQGIGEGGSGFGVAGEGRTLLPAYDSNPDTPDVPPIRVPSILNMAYQEVVMWRGNLGGTGPNLGTEGQWLPGTPEESNNLGMHGVETQAHAGMGVHRMMDVELSQIASNALYQIFYQNAFPSDPTVNHINTALAIGAYVRVVTSNEAPFQKWLRGAKRALTDQELRGAILFFGDAGCVDCHTGPALNSMTFHALGMYDLDNSADPVHVDLDPFGGTIPTEFRLGRGGFTQNSADDYTFKTPQLYNLKDSHFYGHGASFVSVQEVVEYKNKGLRENISVPVGQVSPRFHPLGLSPSQVSDLVAFLEDALYDANLMRHFPTFVPTGLCFPSNDPQSRIDLGCDGALQELRRPTTASKWLQRR